MQAMEVGSYVILALSRDQLGLLANSVNEAIEAVDDWEFSTRLGATLTDARHLRTELSEVIGLLSSEP